jgi:hypothetical protein
MKCIKLVLILCLIPFYSHAQYGMGKKKDILQFNLRNEVVLMKEGYSKDVFDEYSEKKPHLVKAHVEAVDRYNQNLYEVVSKHPLFEGKIISLKSGEEIMAIPHNKTKNYVLVYASNLGSGANVAKYKLIITKDIPGFIPTPDSRLIIYLLEEAKQMGKVPIYITQMNSILPEKLDLTFGFNIAKKYFDYRILSKPSAKNFETSLIIETEKNFTKLKDYTIYINKDDVDPDIVLPKKKIKFRLLERSEYYSKFENDQSDAIFWYPLNISSTSIQFIINSKDNKLYYYSRPNGGIIFLKGYVSDKFSITKKAIKKFEEMID